MPPDMGYTGFTEGKKETAGAGEVSDNQMQAFANSLSPDKWAAMKSYLESLPEGDREKWFQDFAANHGAGRIDAQDAMTRADALRVDQPGMTDTGRGFQMGASPLAHIGAGMQNYQANKQYKQGAADLATANQGMTDQNVAGAKAYMGPLGPQPTPGINPGAAKAGIIRNMAGQPGRGAAPGGMPMSAGPPVAPSMGGPGRGAAPGGMTPEMMQKIMMLRGGM